MKKAQNSSTLIIDKTLSAWEKWSFKSSDMHSSEWLPLYKESVSLVMASPIGRYYYNKLLGENYQENDILYKEKGQWPYKGHLLEIQILINHFENIHGNAVKSRENRLRTRLKSLDRKQGTNIGHKILEVLANFILMQQSFLHNKRYYQSELNKAKRMLKKMRTAKVNLLKKFEEDNQIAPEETGELNRHIESLILRSRAAANVRRIPALFHSGLLLGIPASTFGRENRWSVKLGKEKTVLNMGILKLYDLLKPREDSSLLGIATDISHILNLFGIDTNMRAVEKIIQRHQSEKHPT